VRTGRQTRVNTPEFFSQALMTEWQARRLKGVEHGWRGARFPYVKTIEQFDSVQRCIM